MAWPRVTADTAFGSLLLRLFGTASLLLSSLSLTTVVRTMKCMSTTCQGMLPMNAQLFCTRCHATWESDSWRPLPPSTWGLTIRHSAPRDLCDNSHSNSNNTSANCQPRWSRRTSRQTQDHSWRRRYKGKSKDKPNRLSTTQRWKQCRENKNMNGPQLMISSVTKNR